MRKDAVLTKFVSMLDSFTDEELRSLLAVLENERTKNALIDMVKSVTQLRNGHRNNYARPDFKRSHERGFVISGQLSNGTTEKLREMFFSYFSNPNHYSSVRDVMNALNASFKCQMDYEPNQKLGRRDVLKKCWTALSKLPNEERLRLLTSFFKNTKADDNLSDEYKKLFKILTRNE